MATFFFWLALVLLVVVAGMTLQGVLGARRLHDMADTEPAPGEDLPSISIIVAARNEERDIEDALTSLLALDYPDWELLVVDDRSTDRTGEILARLAAANSHLNVARVEELPAGWLGKNHAQWFGAGRARGEYLLFTDADIVMQPDTLRRAIARMQGEGLDHLTLAPEMRRVKPLLDAYVVTFIIFFFSYFKPWQVRNPKRRAALGIGAFNMVRAETYRQAGGHKTIRMRPDDDLKLGVLMKHRAGGASEVATGGDLISVRWYASVGELVHGLEKNSFAGVEYSLALAMIGMSAMFVLYVWPYLALVLAAVMGWWWVVGLNAAMIAIQWAGFAYYARTMRVPPVFAVLLPVTMLLQIYIITRAIALTYARGGIRWRDTFYPLAELRANKL